MTSRQPPPYRPSHRAVVLVIATLLLAGWAGLASQSTDEEPRPSVTPEPEPEPPAPDTRMAFGLDAASWREQGAVDVPAEYGTLWVGAWTLRNGWSDTAQRLDAMAAQNITPAIHVYYWGDDISRICLETGCWSDLHEAWKHPAGWDDLIDGLIDTLARHAGGDSVVIVLESEFNKGDVQQYEPLDAALAQKAARIHDNYPAAYVVLGLGNWNPRLWSTWDRAAEASDAIGIQAVRAAWEAGDAYRVVYNMTLVGAQLAAEMFGKPVVIHDIALSSLPDQRLAADQAAAIEDFFAGIAALKDAGVTAMYYRSWRDTPSMDIANTFGEAERAWGLADARGSLKPAAEAWILGVLRERVVTDFEATFNTTAGINTWWLEVAVRSNNPPVAVEAVVDGAARPLAKTPWGTWAASTFVPGGAEVSFVAQDVLGQTRRSAAMTWPDRQPPAPIKVELAAKINAWWIEVAVVPTPEAVVADVAGQRVPLQQTAWGTWARSWHVPSGSPVTFETDGPDAVRRSDVFYWP